MAGRSQRELFIRRPLSITNNSFIGLVACLLACLPTWLFITYDQMGGDDDNDDDDDDIAVRLSPPGPHGDLGTNQPLIVSVALNACSFIVY